MSDQSTKTCKRCGIEKPLGRFYRERLMADGYRNDCKVCRETLPPRTFEERYWAKVEFTMTCWHWKGSLASRGYGRFKVGGRYPAAHRVSYELLVGPIPDGMTLDHLCRNPGCVNPEHLEPVPISVNILRGKGVAAKNARKTHCAHGHPLSGDNLVRLKWRNGRGCRACSRESSRLHRERVGVT